jgi:MraZ protein
MLLGTFAPKLDEKGRIILPAKFRDEFAGGVVMTRGQDHCVFVFSRREFEGVMEKIQSAPVSNAQARSYSRMFLSGAAEEIPDKQNRVTIPPMLRSYAGLSRELTVIGAGSRAEIWDTEAWNQYYADTETSFSETDEGVIEGLF